MFSFLSAVTASLMEANNSEPNAIFEEDATKLTHKTRVLLTCLFGVLGFFGIFANLTAIWRTLKRVHRQYYRCCAISLALSDFILSISTTVYSISMFSHPWINWTMGEVMCQLTPFAQTLSVLANSLTLTTIAMDRYQAIINAMEYRWNPSFRQSIFIVGGAWLFASGISVPMLIEYHTEDMVVIEYDAIHQVVTSLSPAKFCAAGSKEIMSTYMALLFALIFFPLLISFLCLYGMICCHLLTRFRDSRSSRAENYHIYMRRHQETPSGGQELPSLPPPYSIAGMTSECTSSEPTIVFDPPLVPPPRPVHPHPVQPCTRYGDVEAPELPARGLGVLQKHTKRLLVIIFALIVSFIITRMPIWAYNLVRTNVSETDSKWWLVQYLLSALSLVGTISNPYLYVFMQSNTLTMENTCLTRCIDVITLCGQRQPRRRYRPAQLMLHHHIRSQDPRRMPCPF